MRVGIVGAGLSGLLAGRSLQAAGHDAVLFEKGPRPGGRLATRHLGDATLDAGAQFFTVRDERFAAIVDGWRQSGLVHEWCRGFGTEPDGHPRYVVRGGMASLAEHSADGLDVRSGTLAFALRPRRTGGWSLAMGDGTGEALDAVVLTCPIPQAFSLTVTADVVVPPVLRRTEYDRTIALLAVLDGPSALPAPGGLQHPDDTFSFIGDNQAKGVSEVPALTFHANAAWSLDWWDRPLDEMHAELRGLAEPWLGTAVITSSEIKRWRFATPQATWPDPCWTADRAAAPLVVAGDAFAGPRVEGAALSGLAAAAQLTSRTS